MSGSIIPAAAAALDFTAVVRRQLQQLEQELSAANVVSEDGTLTIAYFQSAESVGSEPEAPPRIEVDQAHARAVVAIGQIPQALAARWLAAIDDIRNRYLKLKSTLGESLHDGSDKYLLRFIVAELQRELDALSALATEAGPQATPVNPELRTIWYHGGLSYSVDGLTPGIVSAEQHNILKAFLDGNEAINTKALEKCASNVSRIIDQILEIFPGSVRKPPRKGAGYFIRVRTLR